MKSSRLVPLAFAALLPAFGAVAAAPAKLPSPAQALARSVAAHKTLGPVSIRVTLEELKDSKPVSTSVQTVRRNDPEHYVTEFTEGDVTVRLIAKGDGLVMHNVTRKDYRSGKNYRMDLAMPFSRIRDEVAKGLGQPATAKALKAAKLSRAGVNGEPVYRLDWKEAVRLGSLPVKSLSIGVKDGLMRQVLLQDDKAAMRATARYTPRKSPFPAGTFEFVPTPDMRNLAESEPARPQAPEPNP